jgi:hypothetical protein
MTPLDTAAELAAAAVAVVGCGPWKMAPAASASLKRLEASRRRGSSASHAARTMAAVALAALAVAALAVATLAARAVLEVDVFSPLRRRRRGNGDMRKLPGADLSHTLSATVTGMSAER